MKMQDSVSITGSLVIRKNGKIIVNDHNLVVDTGRYLIAHLIAGTGGVITEIRLGNGGGGIAPDPGDVGLVGDTLSVLTVIPNGGQVHDTSAQVEYDASRTEGASLIRCVEAGLFNSAGVMMARKVFPEVNLDPSDTMSLFWTLTVK